MRQVPDPFDLVGDGRTAHDFPRHFNLFRSSVCAWSRRVPAPGPPEALASCPRVAARPASATCAALPAIAASLKGLEAFPRDVFRIREGL